MIYLYKFEGKNYWIEDYNSSLDGDRQLIIRLNEIEIEEFTYLFQKIFKMLKEEGYLDAREVIEELSEDD
ncbi:hypothetical protein [Bacillus sp. V2I10]|uniref:hypothetical protein n=1 Tax=Bacillus sp. V2I10 TaxID=3042276 RepID=UPI0027889F19|nr:hypothetical protein [Bacillus sp. V2I10]MDQ0861594.1 hypothetical protein [Bacillus sp. V2I10]